MAAHIGPGITGDTINVTGTAQAVVTAANFHRTLVIQNLDATNPVYVGGSSTASLTTSNGFRVAAGQSLAFDLPPFAEMFVVGSAEEVRYLVLEGMPG